MRRVRIEGDESGIALGVKVTDAQSGEPIQGIRSMRVHYEVDDLVTADIELSGVVERTFAAARFLVAHPGTGQLLEVTCIKFADGSVWIPEKDPDEAPEPAPMPRYLDTKPAKPGP